MISKEKAYLEIQELVNRFDEQIESYKQADYNETLTRRDFIDPFFKALGWDVDNSQGYAEAYREVIHEDKVKVGKATKAPDYSFRLPGGKRLFFVEAKKPNTDIKNNISVAYQIRRYGWSAKLPVSIITDFEEFAVYDCTKKPKPTDKSGIARIKYIKYTEFLKEFDYLWDTFSKERVLKGSFDRYIKSDTLKKGTATVDKDFLASLDNWRTYLATSISLRNKELDEDEINYAVQLTIDRLIFLRIAEDRGVEQYGQLKISVTQKGDAYQNLFLNFRKADEKYNSGLFDFRKDVISETLKIDNKVIKTIVNEMYYPESPYEFSVISVEILGSAYEQFLGKVIRITPAHQAKIEEKPEVRKAGGVYYTPQYVVDYIVKNTVGKLIDGKTPKQIGKIKICDPACGSGSFLIGAYQYLLDHYKNYYYSFFEKYSKDAANNKLIEFERKKAIRERNKLPLTPDGELDSHLRKEILLNHIFGVDIDTNAVEVTKLSLLLKCMEGITVASIQKLDFKERVLPTLENNIKSGNSLVDVDFYDSVIDFGEEKKVKPFSWQKAFPEVFEQGGFDAVIGNPPYVRSKLLDEYQRDYFSKKYKSAKGTFDIYSIFMEHSFELLKDSGLVAFINPNKYFYSDYGEGIRKVITENYNIESIFDFNEYQVFNGITTYTTVNIFSKRSEKSLFQYSSITDKKVERIIVEDFLLSGIPNIKISTTDVYFNNLSYSNWVFKSKNESNFISRIKVESIPLAELCYKIYQGFVLTPTEVFPVSVKSEFSDFYKIKPIKQDENIYEAEKELLVPIIKSSSIFRYHFETKNYYSIFPYKYINESKVELIPEKILKEEYPKTYEYLKAKSKHLKSREKGKWSNSPNWYEYSRKQNFECQKMKKILVPGLAKNARYTLADENVFIDQGSYGIILNKKNKYLEKFLLSVLNSSLLDFILKSSSGTLSGGYYSYQTKYLNNLPIKIPKDKSVIENIEKKADNLIKAYQDLLDSKLPVKIEQLKSKIQHYESKIDEIVYQLYELTEEEIKIVEESK